jgi:hypothetical protein
MARAAAEFPEPFRRRSIAGLIHERFRPPTFEMAFRGEAPEPVCTVEEIILVAYPSTDAYWHGWLYGWPSFETLIARIAETSATSEIDLRRRRNLLRAVVGRAPLLRLSPTITMAHWLANHPDAVELMPASLVAYLARAPATPAAPKDSKKVMPAEGAALEPQPGDTSDDVPITSEADAAWAYTVRLAEARASTGHPPKRDADYEWAARVWLTRKWFHVTQDMIDRWRGLLLTDAEKRGGAPHK